MFWDDSDVQARHGICILGTNDLFYLSPSHTFHSLFYPVLFAQNVILFRIVMGMLITVSTDSGGTCQHHTFAYFLGPN